MATNALRLEFAPDGVQVLGAYAGSTDTPMQAGNDPVGMNKPAGRLGVVVAPAATPGVVVSRREVAWIPSGWGRVPGRQ
jgi:NAD(P)-dependent dehydrogenase (short-subunit alcohol dehydrogenase family)